MAFQQNANLLKIHGVGLQMAVLKLKINGGANVTSVLSGAQLINAQYNGGSVTTTTNTNACVVTVSFNSGVLDVVWLQSELRDDGQVGNYVTSGNIANEANGSSLSCKLAVFSNGGNTITTNNANGFVIGVALIYRYSNVGTGN
jgi:hypothetical protein